MSLKNFWESRRTDAFEFIVAHFKDVIRIHVKDGDHNAKLKEDRKKHYLRRSLI